MRARWLLSLFVLSSCTSARAPSSSSGPVTVKQYLHERVVAICENMQKCGGFGKLESYENCVVQLGNVACAGGACEEPGDARKLRDACVPAERDRPCDKKGPLRECDTYANPVE